MKPSASTVFASSISSTRLRLYTALRASFCKAKCTLNVVVVRRVVECPENFRHLLPLAKTVAALASAELVHRVSGAACSCCLEWKLGMPAPMAAAAPLRMSSSPSDTNSPIFGGEVDAAYCLTFWRGRSLVTRVTTLVVHSRHAVLCGETELLPVYCTVYSTGTGPVQDETTLLSQSVSYFTVPPRAHPSTGSQLYSVHSARTTGPPLSIRERER